MHLLMQTYIWFILYYKESVQTYIFINIELEFEYTSNMINVDMYTASVQKIVQIFKDNLDKTLTFHRSINAYWLHY
jgi:hypothetical protein